jgi:hypothetical protein
MRPSITTGNKNAHASNASRFAHNELRVFVGMIVMTLSCLFAMLRAYFVSQIYYVKSKE